MSTEQILQAAISLIAAATPWLVVAVVASRAGVHRLDGERTAAVTRARRRLTMLTAVVTVPLIVFAFSVTPPSPWLGAADLVAFAILAVPGLVALHAIDRATLAARELAAAERVASLAPRTIRQFLSPASLLAPYAIGSAALAGFLYRLTTGVENRRWLVPIVCALAAVVFLFLYEAWKREEVTGGQAGGGRGADEIGRRVRAIHGVELGLVSGFLVLAHLALGLDWKTQAAAGMALSVVGAVAGVLGCALAISSGVTGRRYQLHGRS